MNNSSIDPLKFLELKKSEILFKLTGEMGYSEEKACLRFEFMKEMINWLKPLRAFKLQTINYLEDTIKHIPVKARSVTVNSLFTATSSADSYCHAYNFLGHAAYRDLPFPFRPKFIPEHDILVMLEQEKHPVDNIQQQKLSLQQIALKYSWEGKMITKQNKDEIAAQFGYKASERLYENFCKWSKRANRIADPDGSKRIIENKINLFETVINLLPEKNRESAQNELQQLKTILEKTYLQK